MRKTSQQNLIWRKSGRYYARLFHQGKEIWKPLKAEHFSVAKARFAEELKAHGERKGIEVATGDAKMTFVQAAGRTNNYGIRSQ